MLNVEAIVHRQLITTQPQIEKTQALPFTEPKLPIMSSDLAILMIIAQRPVLMAIRVAQSFPKAVDEQLSVRLRPETPLINIHAYSSQTGKGRDRLDDYQSRRRGKSKGSCGACESSQEEGHHGGRRCRRRGVSISNLKHKPNSVKLNISILPSKTSVL